MNYFAISALINLITSLVLGIFIIWRNPLSKTNNNFFFFSLSVAIWSLGYILWQTSNTSTDALIWSRVLMSGAILIPVAYLILVTKLFNNKNNLLLYISCLIATTFFILNLSTNTIVSSVQERFTFEFWPTPGFFFPIYLIYFFSIFLYSTFILFREYKKTNGIPKNQTLYLLIGMFVGFLGGSTNFFIWYNINIPPYANILVSIYVITTSYAILHYRFLDIKVVLKKSFINTATLIIALGIYAFTLLTLSSYIEKNLAVPEVYLHIAVVTLIAFGFNPLKKRIAALINKIFRQEIYSFGKSVERINQALKEVDNKAELFAYIKEQTEKLLKTSNIRIYLKSEDSSSFNLGYPSSDITKKLSYDHSLIRFFNKHNEALITKEIPYLNTEKYNHSIISDCERQLSILKIDIAFPLVVDNNLLGIIFLKSNDRNKSFSVQDIKLLDTLRNKTAQAYANIELYRQTITRLQERV